MRTLAVAIIFALPSPAYIEALYPLQQFLAESTVIVAGEIEKTDLKNRTSIIKVTKTLKGKTNFTHVRINIGGGQDWHPTALMPHMVVGAPALVFYNASAGEVYVNRFFFQVYGDANAPPDKAWYNLTHIDIKCNRTFCGTTEELTKLIGEILTGKTAPPAPDPKMPPMTREHLAALPVWGAKTEGVEFPPSFVKRPPAAQAKPREPENPAAVAKGLDYQYFEGGWTALPDFTKLTPVKSGTADQFDLSKCDKQDNIGLRFTGFIEVPRDGVYLFYTISDDGSALSIGKTEVVNNDGLHGGIEVAGEIGLKAGKHAITVTFFEASGGELLQVLYEGPGITKQAIPAAALFRGTK